MSEMFDKAKDMIAGKEEDIDSAVDKATDFVDDKTGGKTAGVTEKIDSAVDSATDKLAGSGDTPPAAPPQQ
jgi:hypothetical protein